MHVPGYPANLPQGGESRAGYTAHLAHKRAFLLAVSLQPPHLLNDVRQASSSFLSSCLPLLERTSAFILSPPVQLQSTVLRLPFGASDAGAPPCSRACLKRASGSVRSSPSACALMSRARCENTSPSASLPWSQQSRATSLRTIATVSAASPSSCLA